MITTTLTLPLLAQSSMQKRKIEEIEEKDGAPDAKRRLSVEVSAPTPGLATNAANTDSLAPVPRISPLSQGSQASIEISSSEDDSSDSEASTSSDDSSDALDEAEDESSDEDEDEEEEDVIPPPLHSRLKAFLPQLAAANASLLSDASKQDAHLQPGFELIDRQDIGQRRVDVSLGTGENEAVAGQVEKTESQHEEETYIEMELDLGILEEQRRDEEGRRDVLVKDGIVLPRSRLTVESEGGDQVVDGRSSSIGHGEEEASGGILDTLLAASLSGDKSETASKAKIVEIL
jgi:hypothetical protein